MPLPLRGPFLSLSPPHHGAGGPTHALCPDLGHRSHSIAQEGDGGHVITVEMEQAPHVLSHGCEPFLARL